MIVRLYLIDNTWWFLNVYLKTNDTYWIDWEVIYNKLGEEVNNITDKTEINLDYIGHKNVLCMKDDKYYYYDTNNKILQLSVDGISSLENLHNLQNKYDSFIYFIK